MKQPSGVSGKRQKHRLFRNGISEAIVTVILIGLALCIVIPLALPLLFVFKTQLEFSYTPWSLPTRINLENFIEAWNTVNIGQGLINTFIVCIGAIVCTIPPSAMAGYIFARFRNRFTEVIFYAILAGFFVPVQMALIPLYKMNRAIGISNTLYGLFLPMGAFGIPFFVMIYRSFFQSLPKDLVDAARIDGAGETRTFLSVMLPLAAPATVLALVLVFIGSWSDYLLGLILLDDPSKFTMQLRVAQFLGTYGTDKMPRYASAAVIAATPTILLYIVGHKWIIRGTLAGALKG